MDKIFRADYEEFFYFIFFFFTENAALIVTLIFRLYCLQFSDSRVGSLLLSFINDMKTF